MLTRGIRNNNPLNIRIGNEWKGEVDFPTDKEFEQFTSMLWGLRAGFILLRRYICRYHLDTISEIISRWAPSSENNTRAYINTVCERVGCSAHEKISFEDKDKMVRLVDAMVLVECGTTLSNQVIEDAYRLAHIG